MHVYSPSGTNRSSNVTTPLIIPDRLLRFLNTLPVVVNPMEWVSSFREELRLMLGDVDRVAVNVNFNCDLRNPLEYTPTVVITNHSSVDFEDTVSVNARMENSSRSDLLLDELSKQGFPFDQYHSPHSFDYYLEGIAYLGTIILFREIRRSPISEATIELMKGLEPFLSFVLSDLVARRQYADPNVGTFSTALQSLIVEFGLSGQEQKVVILQLFGHSYKEMAEILNISMDGVKHHLKMIHRKTGTRSYTELFAKYFLPKLDLNDPAEDEK
ncbi:MAG: Response regulator [Chlorobi bacterium]|nr:Response regulator [Chlorobiota bacterium]